MKRKIYPTPTPPRPHYIHHLLSSGSECAYPLGEKVHHQWWAKCEWEIITSTIMVGVVLLRFFAPTIQPLKPSNEIL